MAASALRAKNKGSIEYNGASRGEVHRLGGDSIALGPGLYLRFACHSLRVFARASYGTRLRISARLSTGT